MGFALLTAARINFQPQYCHILASVAKVRAHVSGQDNNTSWRQVPIITISLEPDLAFDTGTWEQIDNLLHLPSIKSHLHSDCLGWVSVEPAQLHHTRAAFFGPDCMRLQNLVY